jgi:hypothetical protein
VITLKEEFRHWRPALIAWLVATSVYAAVLTIVELRGQLRFAAWNDQQVVAAMAAHDATRAAMFADGAATIWIQVPWTDIAAFALISATALAVAWSGRRRTALLLPFVTAALTLEPAVNWYTAQPEPLVPHPVGEGGGYALWTALVATPASTGQTMPAWPYLLGTALELVAILVPVLLAPRLTPGADGRRLITLAAVPATVVTISVMATTADTTAWTSLAPALLAIVTILLTVIIASRRTGRLRYVVAIALPAGYAAAVFPLQSHLSFGYFSATPWWAWLIGTSLTTAWVVGRTRTTTWRTVAPAAPVASPAP